MVAIAFIRRILGLGPAHADGPPPADGPPGPGDGPAVPEPEQPPIPEPVQVADMTCPNCGVLVSPPPVSTRLCPRCRHRIVVRKLHGRTVYLAESAVAVYEAERERERLQLAWTTQRRRWLDLARLVGAPEERRLGLAAAPLNAATVASSRSLYLATADQAVKVARRRGNWNEVARVRREQAGALFAEAGSAAPPADDIVALYREGEAATLRAVAKLSKQAELVGASCCAPCRADNGKTFRITDELRTPRLPHPGCPRGLCACDWWPALVAAPARPRRKRRTAASTSVPAAPVPVPVPDPVADDEVPEPTAPEPVPDAAEPVADDGAPEPPIDEADPTA